MRFKILAFVWFAALAVAPITLAADNGCCDEPMACCEKPAMAYCQENQENQEKPAPMACCDEKPSAMPSDEKLAAMTGCDMPCCNGHAAPHADASEPSAIEMLLAMDPKAIWADAAEAPPVRQTATVWFHRPVWVGDTVLMGKYVIEHDTDRQARGEPCTHIYAADDLAVPAATFHCTHLDRNTVEKNTVVLRSLPDGSQKLVEFQFAGEHATHGFPAR